MTKFTVHEFFQTFGTDDQCLDHLMQTRYGKKTECPKCEKVSKFARLKKVKAYSCPHCGHHIHPMQGTPFAKSRTPLQKWFYAMYLFTTSRHGVAAMELQRQLGVTYKTAWRMGHEIRKYMSKVDGDAPLSGVVEVDESMFGGRQTGIGGGFKQVGNKSIILGMMQRDGDVQTVQVPNSRAATLLPILKAQIKPGSTVYTDEAHAYRKLSDHGYDHDKVDHGRKEYARGPVSTNSLEAYWARLKNSIRGTHVHVSKKYLDLYADEFEYRHNMRKTPELMFTRLLKAF